MDAPSPDAAMVEPPSGAAVTFLFTDIDGYGELWERLPRAMAQAVLLHNRLVKDTVALYSGYEVMQIRHWPSTHSLLLFTTSLNYSSFALHDRRPSGAILTCTCVVAGES